MKKLCLVIPSLTSGGLERVMTELAHYFSTINNLDLSIRAISTKSYQPSRLAYKKKNSCN